jgi:hypothetical protein
VLGVELLDALRVHEPAEDAGSLGMVGALGIAPAYALRRGRRRVVGCSLAVVRRRAMDTEPTWVNINPVLIALAATAVFGGIILVVALRPAELNAYAPTFAAIGTLALAVMTVESNRTSAKALGVANRSLDIAKDSLNEARFEREPVLSPYVERKYEVSGGSSNLVFEVGIENVGRSVARNVRVDLMSEVPWIHPRSDPTIVETGSLGVGQRLPLVGLMPNQGAIYAPVEVNMIWTGSGAPQNQIATLDPR